MATTPWYRLWSGMQNDPKWRTIARLSQQRIGDVISVFLHVLDNASNATERGRTENLNPEDIASALDLETLQVDAILAAMQGRVMDGECVSAWEKRQPIREDGSAERSKAWREEQKAKKEREQPPASATERTANAAERTETPREEKSREEEIPPSGGKARKRAAAPAMPPPGLEEVPERMLADYMAVRKDKRAGPLTDTAVKGLLREAGKAGITAEAAVRACCEFGWQGFNAGWYAERMSQRSTTAAGAGPAETVYQRSMRERMQQAVPSIARRAPAPAQDAADFFRTVEVPARVVPDSNAIEVTP